MSQNEQGMLYPFRLSGSRMRQGAAALRRQGQVLDALTLLRRAAEQEDTPSAWLSVAEEQRALGCWEAAAQLLARVLSVQEHPPGAWLEMARCLAALGRNELAADCLYHQLQEDPWSPEGDAARAMLPEVEGIPEARRPRREAQLIADGLTLWSAGEREKGERKIRRALKIAEDKGHLLTTAAMLCMLEGDFKGAARYLARALRLDPCDARALTSLATLCHQRGKIRMARGFLRLAAPHCDTVLTEDGFLTAAWAQDAWAELTLFLEERLKRHPHRIPLLSAKATMCYEQGDVPGAQQLWREILAIDPDDRHAAAMMAASNSGAERCLIVPGMLPAPQRRRQVTDMQIMLESGEPLSVLLRHGTASRRLIDWCLTGSDIQENRLAAELLSRSGDDAEIPFLKELLARPFLRMDARQWALIRLAELGVADELLMSVGNHFTSVQCQKVSEKKQRSPWRMFLPGLLSETRHYRQSGEVAEFAASVWDCMSRDQQLQAAGSGRYVWCKAMEVLWLRMTGHETLAVQVVRHSPLSPRRISRVLRQLAACLEPGALEED